MAVRGVYSEAEQRMLDDTEKDPYMKPGWFNSPTKMVATEESIKRLAICVDYWNPIWRDDHYAQNTRWGGIIAPPMYQQSFGYSGTFGLHVNPECGFLRGAYIGEEWEFFEPVRPGDSFKVWRNRPQVIDATSLDGKGPRTFVWLPHDICHINQKNELVSTLKTYLEYDFYDEDTEQLTNMPKPKHKYTKEELDYIERIGDEEEIRGADIRWWDDVGIGDEAKPVIIGPTTAWDMIVFCMGAIPADMFPPMRDLRKNPPETLIVDPDTGVSHNRMEHHFTHEAGHLEGVPHGFHAGTFAATLMARCVTNWMGDDGFIRKYKWRHLTQTPIGDTVIGHGRVVNKRIENGEHLVDLDVYLENIRGNITEAAAATVRLLSREATHTWK
jgi:acyl dehydratase